MEQETGRRLDARSVDLEVVYDSSKEITNPMNQIRVGGGTTKSIAYKDGSEYLVSFTNNGIRMWIKKDGKTTLDVIANDLLSLHDHPNGLLAFCSKN